jgi:GNAT superfamily N-acetyltransferase
MGEISIVTIVVEHADALAQLQRDCFPTLGPSEWMVADHFLNHCRLFPEGNFVALDGERVVGLGGGFFIDFDFDHPDHTFLEVIAGGYYTRHDPAGAYYYGADISVHPDYRNRGIGGRLYEARKAVVRQFNKKGIVAGGLIPGFAFYKDQMSAEEYVTKVVAGELRDNTLTFQLRNGFRVRGVLQNYIKDSASDNWATLIEWPNPDYR